MFMRTTLHRRPQHVKRTTATSSGTSRHHRETSAVTEALLASDDADRDFTKLPTTTLTSTNFPHLPVSEVGIICNKEHETQEKRELLLYEVRCGRSPRTLEGPRWARDSACLALGLGAKHGATELAK